MAMRRQRVEIKVGQQRSQEAKVVRLAEYTLYHLYMNQLFCRLVFLAVYLVAVSDWDGKRYDNVSR